MTAGWTYRQLTEDERWQLAPRARELYEAGLTIGEVAAEFGVGSRQARNFVILAGGEIRSRHGQSFAGTKLDRLADEVDAELRPWHLTVSMDG